MAARFAIRVHRLQSMTTTHQYKAHISSILTNRPGNADATCRAHEMEGVNFFFLKKSHASNRTLSQWQQPVKAVDVHVSPYANANWEITKISRYSRTRHFERGEKEENSNCKFFEDLLAQKRRSL